MSFVAVSLVCFLATQRCDLGRWEGTFRTKEECEISRAELRQGLVDRTYVAMPFEPWEVLVWCEPLPTSEK